MCPAAIWSNCTLIAKSSFRLVESYQKKLWSQYGRIKLELHRPRLLGPQINNHTLEFRENQSSKTGPGNLNFQVLGMYAVGKFLQPFTVEWPSISVGICEGKKPFFPNFILESLNYSSSPTISKFPTRTNFRTHHFNTFITVLCVRVLALSLERRRTLSAYELGV